MKELFGNLWALHDSGKIIAITTNGTVTRDGLAVMGRGIARDARDRFPSLATRLAAHIIRYDLHLAYFPDLRLMCFPVKYEWKQEASLPLIRQSRNELEIVSRALDLPVYMVRPGCGNGGLEWEVVRPIMAALPDRITIVEWEVDDPYLERKPR